jgi:acyl-CoA thioesterase-1
MSPELIAMYAMLLSLLGPARAGEPNINTPRELILKPGSQIVAIGDSITAAAGYLNDVDAVLAKQYPELKLPRIQNVGIGGQKAEDLVQRFQKDVIDKKPAIVTISVGINDVWHRAGDPHDPQVLAQYWINVSKMVEMAQKAGIKVILLAPTVIGENAEEPTNKRLRIYVEAEKQVARDRKCTMVDLHEMFLTVLAKRPAEQAGKDKWLTSDGVHMSPVGDALMAIGVLHALGVPDRKIAGG